MLDNNLDTWIPSFITSTKLSQLNSLQTSTIHTFIPQSRKLPELPIPHYHTTKSQFTHQQTTPNPSNQGSS
ncbi:hypothetical protein BDW59DRAFT_136914 [Aspergillus cavernicola]|uniref:Uncharacterized protein n=1 Tax=Aspergillus cavernicola TaxID=176166 RepID=A0ABR4J4M3_9EURO